MGTTLLTKIIVRNKAQKHFLKKNEVQCRDNVPAKWKVENVRLLSLVALPAILISIFLCPNCYLCT